MSIIKNKNMEQVESLKPLNIRIFDKNKFNRHELKSVIRLNQIGVLLNGIKLQGGQEIYSSRIINSIYFDSLNYNAYNQSEEGITPRKKIRIRNYPKDIINFNFLEIKYTLPYGRQKSSLKINNNYFERAIKMGIMLNHSFIGPVLSVQYLRSYYQLGEDRVTIDQDIKFNALGKLSHTAANLDELLVVEVKTKNAMRGRQILSKLNLNLRRFSKYCSGIRLLF